jgi:hypothetical protein
MQRLALIVQDLNEESLWGFLDRSKPWRDPRDFLRHYGDFDPWSLDVDDLSFASAVYMHWIPESARRDFVLTRASLGGSLVEVCGVVGPSAHDAVGRLAQKAWNACFSLMWDVDIITLEELEDPNGGPRAYPIVPSIDRAAVKLSFLEREPGLEAAQAQMELEYTLVRKQSAPDVVQAGAAQVQAVATQQALAGPGSADCYVTLLQIASIVNRSKKTLEGYRDRGELPPPDIEGGGRGKPNEWKWETVRPWLETKFGRSLPSVFPADRFRRS